MNHKLSYYRRNLDGEYRDTFDVYLVLDGVHIPISNFTLFNDVCLPVELLQLNGAQFDHYKEIIETESTLIEAAKRFYHLARDNGFAHSSVTILEDDGVSIFLSAGLLSDEEISLLKKRKRIS